MLPLGLGVGYAVYWIVKKMAIGYGADTSIHEKLLKSKITSPQYVGVSLYISIVYP